jgi:hypothetical protein
MSGPVPTEVSWGWIYLPPSLFTFALGALVAWLVSRVLNRTGLSRYFWHPPLALLAMTVFFSALIGLFWIAP